MRRRRDAFGVKASEHEPPYTCDFRAPHPRAAALSATNQRAAYLLCETATAGEQRATSPHQIAHGDFGAQRRPKPVDKNRQFRPENRLAAKVALFWS